MEPFKGGIPIARGLVGTAPALFEQHTVPAVAFKGAIRFGEPLTRLE